MRFRELALHSKELMFGRAKYPLKYGTNLEIGNGKVVPEIKYFKRIGTDPKEEFRTITDRILKRIVDLGGREIQLETELTYVEMEDPKLVGEIVNLQKGLIEKYSQEYDLNLGLRITVADIRDFGKPKHDEEGFNKMLETFELAAENGADVLSIESEGGKELFNYAIIRQDVMGIISALGVLAILDMKKLWGEIVRIANKKNVKPGGDSACAFGNTAMRLAGGVKDNIIPHTLAAIVRAMTASRSLVAFEEGAVGPGKDCAYENVMIKAITGYPISMEGKSAAVAHSSLVGNISGAVCDLWSNEQVEDIKLFGGYGPEVFTEILYYDTKIMNKAAETGKQEVLKQLLVESDNYVDPQAYILSPDAACEIGKAIVSGNDELTRTINSGLRSSELMLNERKLNLNKSERRFLETAKSRLEDIQFHQPMEKVEQALSAYKQKVSKLRLQDYFN